MYSLKDLLKSIDCDYDVLGSMDVCFATFDSIYNARESSASWLRATGDAGLARIASSPARVIICSRMPVPMEIIGPRAIVQVDMPQVAFMRAMKNLLNLSGPEAGIHPTAVVNADARIDENVSIGPYCVIGNCKIGAGTVINAYSCIHDGTVMGKNVLIGEHCNIGGVGFSFIMNEHHALENMEHIGRAIIEDDVAIFPYSNVDRGTLGDTIVGCGTKIDHYCHIGHNSRVGRNTVIAANVTTCGGVSIGDECVIGCGTLMRELTVIGDRVITGLGSVVTRNVPDGETWVGSPAREIQGFKNLQLVLKTLDETVVSRKTGELSSTLDND